MNRPFSFTIPSLATWLMLSLQIWLYAASPNQEPSQESSSTFPQRLINTISHRQSMLAQRPPTPSQQPSTTSPPAQPAPLAGQSAPNQPPMHTSINQRSAPAYAKLLVESPRPILRSRSKTIQETLSKAAVHEHETARRSAKNAPVPSYPNGHGNSHNSHCTLCHAPNDNSFNHSNFQKPTSSIDSSQPSHQHKTRKKRIIVLPTYYCIDASNRSCCCNSPKPNIPHKPTRQLRRRNHSISYKRTRQEITSSMPKHLQQDGKQSRP